MLDPVLRLLNRLFALSVPFTHVGGYVTGGLSVVLIGPQWKRLRAQPVFVWLLLFILYGIVRSALSADPQIGYRTMVGYVGHWLLPFTLGFLLRSPDRVRQVVWTYLLTFMALVFLSVLAYYGLFYPKLGRDWYLVDMGLLKAFRSHISLAGLCLMSSFLMLSLALTDRSVTRFQRGFRVAATGLFLGGIVLTGSRGYYLAAVASYSLFAVWWVLRTGRWKAAAGAGLGIAVLAALLYAAAPVVRERIHRTGPQDRNVQERIALYRVALWEIQARPMFGFGPGQGVRQGEYFDRLPEGLRDVARYPHLHSLYLNCAAEFGMVGFVVFLIIWGLLLRRIWRVSVAAEGFVRPLAFGMFWGLVGVLAGDCFDAVLRGPGNAMPVFWLSGLVLGCDARPSTERAPGA